MTEWQPTFDGLTLPGDQAQAGGLEAAAIATLAALDEQGLLEPRHALLCQMVVRLAGALDRDMAAGKITVAASNAQRLLLDAFESLPTTSVADDEAWGQFVEQLQALDQRAAEGTA